MLQETNDTGGLLDEYVFFNGSRTARRNSTGTVYYYFGDHLGSSRVIVQASATAACYEADYYAGVYPEQGRGDELARLKAPQMTGSAPMISLSVSTAANRITSNNSAD